MQEVIRTPSSSASASGIRGGFLVLAGVVAVAATFLGPLAAMPVIGLLVLAGIMARPEYGIALFMSTFLMAYPKVLQGSGYLTINNVLGGIFGVMMVYELYRYGDWWFLRLREIQLLLFIVAMYFVSEQINGPDPLQLQLLGSGFYFAEGLRTFSNRVAFTLFFILYIRTPSHLRMIYLLAIALMVITALTGVQGVLRGGGLKGYRAFTETTELVSGQIGLIRAAGNPNRLAMFAILAISGLWYLTKYLGMPALRYLALMTIAILGLAVFMTASRSGLLGLVVCLIGILLDEGLDLRKVLSFMLAGLLLTVMVVQFVPEKSLERITNFSSESGEGSASLEHRQGVLAIARQIFAENPILGVGMGNWAVAHFIADPGHSAGAPHNSYVLALVEGGFLCLAGFLALFWRTWSNIRFAEAYATVPGSPLGQLAWIAKSAKINLLVLVFFSMVADLWNLVILFMLVGIGVVIRRLVEERERADALAY